MRYSDEDKAEIAKAATKEASNNLRTALAAFNYNCNCTASDKTTLRRRPTIAALALSTN